MSQTPEELEAALIAKYSAAFGDKGPDFGLAASVAAATAPRMTLEDFELGLRFSAARVIADNTVEGETTQEQLYQRMLTIANKILSPVVLPASLTDVRPETEGQFGGVVRVVDGEVEVCPAEARVPLLEPECPCAGGCCGTK